MEVQTAYNPISIEQLCARLEQLMKANFLSADEKEELATRIIEAIQEETGTEKVINN